MNRTCSFRRACLFLKYCPKVQISLFRSVTVKEHSSNKSNLLHVRKLIVSSIRFRRRQHSTSGDAVFFKYALLIIPISTFGLGTWQVQRRKWKLNLMAELNEKVNLAPVELPESLDNLEHLEYNKIKVQGSFDHSNEIYVGPRSLMKSGDVRSTGSLISSPQSGFNVVTPFKVLDRDLTILVNRGWIARNKKNPSTRLAGQIEGNIELIGLVRRTETRGPFMPEHKKGASTFLYRDVDAMSVICNCDPYFIDAVDTFPEGPIGSQTRVSLRNEHLSYLITWYSLSLATSYLWYKRFILGKALM